MRTNEAWVKLGSSVAAALLAYLITNIQSGVITTSWKIIIITIIIIAALAIAFWSGKHPKEKENISIGTNITAKKDIIIKKIEVASPTDKNVNIGSNIVSDQNVQIQDIHLNVHEKNND